MAEASARPTVKAVSFVFGLLCRSHLHDVTSFFSPSSVVTYNSWCYIESSHVVGAHGPQSLQGQPVKTWVSRYPPFPALIISVFSQELNFSCGLFPAFRHWELFLGREYLRLCMQGRNIFVDSFRCILFQTAHLVTNALSPFRSYCHFYLQR